MAELILSDYGVGSIVFTPVDPTIYSDAPGSAVAFVRKKEAAYYEADITLTVKTKADYRSFSAFMNSLQGRFGTFTVKLPTESAPLGTNLSGVTLAGTETAGSTSLLVNCSAGAVFKAGDKFTLASHSKVYEVSADANESGGQATISIYPPLRVTTGSPNALTFTDCLFTLRRTDDRIRYATRPPELYTMRFSAREAL